MGSQVTMRPGWDQVTHRSTRLHMEDAIEKAGTKILIQSVIHSGDCLHPTTKTHL